MATARIARPMVCCSRSNGVTCKAQGSYANAPERGILLLSRQMTRFGPGKATLDDHRQRHEEIAAGREATAA
jgi:hypothetical protein